jgi:hypothetical protein
MSPSSPASSSSSPVAPSSSQVAPSSSQVALDRLTTVGSISYRITAAGDGDEPIDLVIAGRDPDGRVLSSLTGEIRLADLPAVADLLSSTLAGLVSVHHPPSGRRRPDNQGVRWSAEDDARLVARHREGATAKALMEEFGRTRGGIQARLEHLGEIPTDQSSGATARRPAGDQS